LLPPSLIEGKGVRGMGYHIKNQIYKDPSKESYNIGEFKGSEASLLKIVPPSLINIKGRVLGG